MHGCGRAVACGWVRVCAGARAVAGVGAGACVSGFVGALCLTLANNIKNANSIEKNFAIPNNT